MSDERERVEHPSWCDRENCTAPEYRPVGYDPKTSGQHVSAKLRLSGAGTKLEVWLSQWVAPWDCDTYLCLRDEKSDMATVSAYSSDYATSIGDEGTGGQGFALYELLASGIAPLVRQYPTLYAERFPHLAETPPKNEEKLMAEDVDEVETLMATCTPNSSPYEDGRVEHGYQINVLDQAVNILATVDLPDWESFRPASAGHRLIERGYMIRPDARGPETVNGWREAPTAAGISSWFAPVIRLDIQDTTGSSNGVSETQDVGGLGLLEPTFQLTVNSRVMKRGTLQEVRLAVVNLVTTRLAAAPERVANDAHAINLAWNSNIVKQALAERGQWFTVLDAHGEDPLRIRVTREG